MTLNRHCIIPSALLFTATVSAAQKQINTISTTNSSSPPVTYTNIKGAGIKSAYGILSSNWDSIASNYTVNFNASPNNITSITQFTVAGLANTFISWPVNSFIKLRRNGNAYVNDARNHYYVSVPASWQQKQITVSLFDAGGALVQKKNFTTSTTEIKFTLNKVSTGTYFLHVTNLYNQESAVKHSIISK
jgi:hypothetical protein